jgi:MSHA biogenesis protein MshE
MNMNDYLTFEEAADFLSTPHSTLYRWLKAGKVPGHKLGRQWRFLRSELEDFRSSGNRSQEENTGLADLAQLLQHRNQQEAHMITDCQPPSAIAEHLIWDAVDNGATVIHLGPAGEKHEIRYRTPNGLLSLHQLPTASFTALDRYWISISQPVRNENNRRLYLERKHNEDIDRLQIRYQKLETFLGEKLVLHLIQEGRFPQSIDAIVNTPRDAEILGRWACAPRGLFLIAGRSGSGKTTTAYCCLEEMARTGDRILFTIENSIEILLRGVNQVSVDLDDEVAYRRAFVDIFNADLNVLFISSNFAQRHLQTLWGSALSAAESGHLVMVQLEAESAEDALAKFSTALDRPIEDYLLGVVWQELITDQLSQRRRANYQFISGTLDTATNLPE